jgi:hypothetical protein
MDARRFFSTGMDGRGNLSQTLLWTTYKEVAAGIVQAHSNTPYAEEPSEGTDEPYNRGITPTRETRIFRHVQPLKQRYEVSSPSTQP